MIPRLVGLTTIRTVAAARWNLRSVSLAATAATILVLVASGCGSEDSDDSPSKRAESSASMNTADGLVGEWVAENRCDDLVDALRKAGLDAYIGRMLAGQYRNRKPVARGSV